MALQIYASNFFDFVGELPLMYFIGQDPEILFVFNVTMFNVILYTF